MTKMDSFVVFWYYGPSIKVIKSHLNMLLKIRSPNFMDCACYINKNDSLPLPLRPTNLRSLNLATWFFITAVEFRSSAQQFSSLPARTVTMVLSPTSPKATTLNATGRVLLDLQCTGKTVHTRCGEPAINIFLGNYYLHGLKYGLKMVI